MGRIIIGMLAAFAPVLFGCSGTTRTQAPATGKRVKLTFDRSANAFNLRADGGDTVDWTTPIDFPLTSPCTNGETMNITSCLMANVTGVFPYTCSGNNCPDPEIDVGTDGVPPLATKTAEPKTETAKGAAPAPAVTSRLLGKNVYLECVNTAAALFPGNIVVPKDSSVFWKASGGSPERQWTVNAPSGLCTENMINQGQNKCTVTMTGTYQYTMTLGNSSSCATKTATGMIEVR
jgi:hypothetical protein